MKTLFPIIALMVVGLGCATQNIQTIPFDPNASEKVISHRMLAEPIPLPETAPFDSNANEREAYIDGFCKAWNYVASGIALHGTLGVSKPVGFEAAWDSGWQDGYKIAWSRWQQESEKLRKEESTQLKSSP